MNLKDVQKAVRDHVRYKHQARDLESVEHLKRALDGEPLATGGRSIPKAAGVKDESRDDTVNHVSSQLAFLLPLTTPVDLVLEFLHVSLTLMPQGPGSENLEHWLAKARYNFQAGQLRKLAEETQRKQDQEQILALIDRPLTVTQDSTPEILDDSWKELLTKDKKTGAIQPTGPNLGLLFEHAPTFRDAFRFNLMSKDVDIDGGIFAKEPKASLPVAVSNWLTYQMNFRLKKQEVEDQILNAALHHSYDPLRDMLLATKWDGIKRWPTFFVVYCKSPKTFEDGSDATYYYSKIGPKWATGAVARALTPGELVKAMLVIEGLQNQNKSAALAALFKPYFTDAQIKIGDKDASLIINSTWGIELAELSFAKGATANEIKNFLSRRDDMIRLPYGRITEKFPRRAILIGTTNDEHYLTDTTGNVRTWSVKVGRIDIDAILRDREQLWAEAVYYYQANEAWWLDDQDTALAEIQTSKRMVANPMSETVVSWWYNMEPDKRPQTLTTTEALVRALGMSPERVNTQAQKSMGSALRGLGMIGKTTNAGIRFTANQEILEAVRVPLGGVL